MKIRNNLRFIISRTDGIGDAILTMPILGLLKSIYPDCQLYFLGRTYTEPVINSCSYVDFFLDWEEIQKLSFKEQINFFAEINADEIIHVFPNKHIANLSKLAKIHTRTGTKNRIYHWLYCNNRVDLSRKNSNLHESQLNIKLVQHHLNKANYSIDELANYIGFENKYHCTEKISQFIDKAKNNIILHPKSHGSAREWGLDNYKKLIYMLPPEKYNIIITGSEIESQLYNNELVAPFPFVKNAGGKLSLNELICLIANADALLACSTGPLHVAGALNINTFGIYPPMPPIHPTRWSPLGKKIHVFAKDTECNRCKKSSFCECIHSISPNYVAEIIKKSI